MGIFGWDLPPGCTQRHIDEAYGGDSEAAAFFDLMHDQLPASLDENVAISIVEWAWGQVSDAYGLGYKQGQNDAKFAAEQDLGPYREFKR